MTENYLREDDVRRLLSVLLILALAASLTGCLGDASIDELLSAPTLSSRQNAVMSALERELGEQITFVFPSTGTSRAAVQFIDLDSDGNQEAVVFYKDSRGINASMAVLRQEAGGYAVTSVTEGLGDRINSVRFLRSEDENTGRKVLVEWRSRNAASSSMAVYTYTGSSLDLGFEESGTNLLVIEHPEDGGYSFCYLLPPTGDTMTVKSVRLYGGSSVSGHYSLDRSARSIRQMVAGETADGVLIFVDEVTDSGFRTEVLRCDPSSHLGSAVTAEGYDTLWLDSRELVIKDPRPRRPSRFRGHRRRHVLPLLRCPLRRRAGEERLDLLVLHQRRRRHPGALRLLPERLRLLRRHPPGMAVQGRGGEDRGSPQFPAHP